MLPVAYLVIRASQAGSAAWDRLFQPETVTLLASSAGLALCVAGASIVIAVPFAWLVTWTDLPFRRVWAVLGPVPLVIPSYVGALAYISAFGPRGLLQQVLEGPFGIDRLPEIYGFGGAFLTLTLFSYPYVLLLAMAALRRLDMDLVDSARGLGRRPARAFAAVALPQLRPALSFGGLLCALYTLSDFGVVSLMRFDTFTRVIYVHYRSLYDRTGAALFALVLVALTVAFVFGEHKLRGDARRNTTSSSSRQRARVQLGRWKPAAITFLASVTGLALVVPGAVLTYWLVRSLHTSFELTEVSGAVLGSFSGSALAALVATALALPVAIAAARSHQRAARVIEGLATSGFALPGIVIALGLVFFATRYVSFVYQTLALLVVAYVIRFLPQAVGAARAAIARADPQLEEAARSLGHGRASIFLRITLPLAGPGIAAGALLVFLTAMKELPATLILKPIGFDTLATQVWSAASTSSYGDAALPALLLIAISAIPLAFATARGARLGAPGAG